MLQTIFARLYAHFGALTGPGAARPWWPIYGADPPFEMLVGAVLVQQTRWETVEAAVLRLLDVGLLAPAALAAADPVEIAAMIRPAAFHTQKAPGLIAVARHIDEHYGGSTAAMLARPTAALRAELLALPRVGRETCDVVMLYGGGHPVFVVDEYTRRLFERVMPARDERPKTKDEGSRDARTTRWRAPYEVVRAAIEAELAGPQPSALSPQPSALSPQPSALSPQPSALSPQPSALSPQPSALIPHPSSFPLRRVSRADQRGVRALLPGAAALRRPAGPPCL